MLDCSISIPRESVSSIRGKGSALDTLHNRVDPQDPSKIDLCGSFLVVRLVSVLELKAFAMCSMVIESITPTLSVKEVFWIVLVKQLFSGLLRAMIRSNPGTCVSIPPRLCWPIYGSYMTSMVVCLFCARALAWSVKDFWVVLVGVWGMRCVMGLVWCCTETLFHYQNCIAHRKGPAIQ